MSDTEPTHWPDVERDVDHFAVVESAGLTAIYDTDHPEAWVRSDVARSLDEMR